MHLYVGCTAFTVVSQAAHAIMSKLYALEGFVVKTKNLYVACWFASTGQRFTFFISVKIWRWTSYYIILTLNHVGLSQSCLSAQWSVRFVYRRSRVQSIVISLQINMQNMFCCGAPKKKVESVVPLVFRLVFFTFACCDIQNQNQL